MHIVIIFYNIGGYHAARLRAAHAACQQEGWSLTAIQVTDHLQEWPWGEMKREITFPLKTLLPVATTPPDVDRGLSSTVPASLLPAHLDVLQPDILVIPGWGFPISRAALAWCKRHKIPGILMSESKWDDEKRQWWKEQIKSWFYVKRFDAALVGGELHRDYLIKLGFPRERIFLGYDVVDNDYFTQGTDAVRQNPLAARQRQQTIPSRPYFLVVTRFIKRKNVSLLIEAFAAYRQQVGNQQAWDLVICGNGQEEAFIRQQILKNELTDSVHLPGFITYQAIVDWFALASTFIHPALQEQWGLVVNEAMASGLPVVVSKRCGCFRELINEGVNGFGFNPDDSRQLSQLMLKLSCGEIDLQKMSNSSREHIQLFSPKHFAQGLLASVKSSLKI